jgi:uncharacterized membrane protein YjjP (DUF1212 family)
MDFEKKPLEPTQRAVTRLVAQAGQLLLAHGAESALVGDIMRRFGKASGVENVEVSLSASSLVISTVHAENCITTVRRCADSGINMRMVSQVQQICILLEKGTIDFTIAQEKLDAISHERHNRWLVVVLIGFSCASFSRFAGGDWTIYFMTCLASACGMIVRQELGHRHYNPFLNFAVTAFVTSVISAPALAFNLGNKPELVMASSVLMLVPGYPLINSVSDMLKGYTTMGISRFVKASLLTLVTCLGIIGAMSITGVWGW